MQDKPLIIRQLGLVDYASTLASMQSFTKKKQKTQHYQVGKTMLPHILTDHFID